MGFVVYFATFCLTSLYALILEHLKKRLEPDLTWVEVAVGCALCLFAPLVLARISPTMTWQDYESSVWLSFVVGGLPIIIGQFIRTRRTVEDAIATLRDLNKKAHYGNSAEEVAEERGICETTND